MIQGYDYTALVDDAMRGVVREVLRQVQQRGLADPHHFFVTYRTTHPGVVMSDALRARYPHEITIVLQHQFRDLKVEQECFRVVLSFNNIPERLTIPFSALIGFADPSMKFGLQFHADEGEIAPVASPTLSVRPVKDAIDEPEQESGEEEGDDTKIITLDAFRKK